jgi:hypothetical protein
VLTTDGWSAMRWSCLGGVSRERWRMTVIDGSAEDVAETGRAVLQWIRDATAGLVPMFSRVEASA